MFIDNILELLNFFKMQFYSITVIIEFPMIRLLLAKK